MQRRRVRRDRHGRGLRGPLAPPGSPARETRADAFADLVVDAVDRLEPRWGPLLREVDVEVHDVPPDTGAGSPPAGDLVEVPLSDHRPATRHRPATVVVYRRPVELRATDRPARVDLVRDLVAEELGAALGLAPEQIDPTYEVGDED